jgi:hypothetical protein
MEAGRELDALVAEKVMGAENVRWIRPELGWPNQPVQATYAGAGNSEYQSVPRYSTDIKAAWRVLSGFVERGWWPDLSLHSDGASAPGWRCRLGHTGIETEAGQYSYSRAGTTAPHAICLCALAAVNSGPRVSRD